MPNNTEWYSASRLIRLSGLPVTVRGINKKAVSENWTSRKRQGRGGGREYHISSLPEETRITLAAQAASVAINTSADAQHGAHEGRKLYIQAAIEDKHMRNNREKGSRQFVSLTESEQRRVDAKLIILQGWETFCRNITLPVRGSLEKYSEQYNNGTVEIEDWVRNLIPKLSANTLHNYRKIVRENGIAALAGNYGNRKGSSKIEQQPELKEGILAILTAYPHASATHVMKSIKARFARTGIDLPSKRSLTRFLNTWKEDNKQVYTAIANPDEWKNKYMSAYGSASEGIARLNQLWELDSTPGDVMLTDGRHSIIGNIDVYSRRGKLLVSKTSKASAIASLVRRSLLDWGVLEKAKTDNGQDYKSYRVRRAFKSLGVEQEFCPPFQPWKKPHIERFLGTFSHDLVELLGGFIGHNVAERSAIEARTSFADRLMKKDEVVEINMSSDEFQDFCDRWVENVYHHNSHAGLNGKTPFQMVADYRGAIATIEDERALDVLLAEAPGKDGWCAVTKKGIRLDNGQYIHEDLGLYTGQRVRVLYDENDIGRVYVFGGPDLEFICIAEDPERTGISRKEVAVYARQRQMAAVQEQRRELKKAARKFDTSEIVNEILAQRAADANTVTLFPKPSEQYTSPGLEAAANAAAARDGDQHVSVDIINEEEVNARRAAIEAQIRAEKTITERVFDTPFERAQFLTLESSSRKLTDDEQEYVDCYRKGNPRSASMLDALLETRNYAK